MAVIWPKPPSTNSKDQSLSVRAASIKSCNYIEKGRTARAKKRAGVGKKDGKALNEKINIVKIPARGGDLKSKVKSKLPF